MSYYQTLENIVGCWLGEKMVLMTSEHPQLLQHQS